MPIIEKTQEQVEYEREVELEDQARFDDVAERQRAHELALAEGRHKRDADIARLKHATAPRQQAITRVLVAVCKTPALILLSVMLPVITLAGKEIPHSLDEFLIL